MWLVRQPRAGTAASSPQSPPHRDPLHQLRCHAQPLEVPDGPWRSRDVGPRCGTRSTPKKGLAPSQALPAWAFSSPSRPGLSPFVTRSVEGRWEVGGRSVASRKQVGEGRWHVGRNPPSPLLSSRMEVGGRSVGSRRQVGGESAGGDGAFTPLATPRNASQRPCKPTEPDSNGLEKSRERLATRDTPLATRDITAQSGQASPSGR